VSFALSSSCSRSSPCRKWCPVAPSRLLRRCPGELRRRPRRAPPPTALSASSPSSSTLQRGIRTSSPPRAPPFLTSLTTAPPPRSAVTAAGPPSPVLPPPLRPGVSFPVSSSSSPCICFRIWCTEAFSRRCSGEPPPRCPPAPRAARRMRPGPSDGHGRPRSKGGAYPLDRSTVDRWTQSTGDGPRPASAWRQHRVIPATHSPPRGAPEGPKRRTREGEVDGSRYKFFLRRNLPVSQSQL
jgi:hypothetical protein